MAFKIGTPVDLSALILIDVKIGQFYKFHSLLTIQLLQAELCAWELSGDSVCKM